MTLTGAMVRCRLARRVEHLVLYVTARCPPACRTRFLGGLAPCPDPSLEELAGVVWYHFQARRRGEPERACRGSEPRARREW